MESRNRAALSDPSMSPRPVIALQAVIVAAVPLLLVGNMLWLLVTPAFVHAQYALPGIPVPVANLGASGQERLGLIGVEAVHPAGIGVAALEEARLDNGRPAFTRRELRHMSDVRTVVKGAFWAWGIALLAGAAAIVVLWRRRRREAVRRALARGAELTLAATLLLGLGMAVSFDAVFEGFHGALFADGTWRFPDDSTLITLYPDAFWTLAGAAAAVLIVVQAAAVRAVMRTSEAVGASRAGG